MQINVRVRIRGTIGETSFKPSRREARISRENGDGVIDQLAAPHRKRNIIAHVTPLDTDGTLSTTEHADYPTLFQKSWKRRQLFVDERDCLRATLLSVGQHLVKD